MSRIEHTIAGPNGQKIKIIVDPKDGRVVVEGAESVMCVLPFQFHPRSSNLVVDSDAKPEYVDSIGIIVERTLDHGLECRAIRQNAPRWGAMDWPTLTIAVDPCGVSGKPSIIPYLKTGSGPAKEQIGRVLPLMEPELATA